MDARIRREHRRSRSMPPGLASPSGFLDIDSGLPGGSENGGKSSY